MIFGLFQIALGVALIAAALVFGGVAWVLAWPGVAVIVVGLGYLGLGPRVFGKRREDGRLASWTIAIVLPYIAVAWLLWQVKSRLYRERAWDEVAPGVRLGRRPLGPHELPRAVPEIAVRYVCLPTLDTAVAPDPELAALLDALAEDEGPLFIHCAMGHGRSATVAAALLIRRGHCHDVDEAIAMLVRARPRVRLHPIQRAAVMRLAGVRPQASRATHLA